MRRLLLRWPAMACEILEYLLTFAHSSIGNCPSGTYYSNGYCYRNSGWYYWGRWLFAGIVIAFVIAVIVCLG